MWFVNKPQRGEERRGEALVLFNNILLPSQPKCLKISCGQGVGASILSGKFNADVIANDILILNRLNWLKHDWPAPRIR